MAPASDRPLYRRIADDLSHRVHQEEWPPGERLPSETALAEHYQAHRLTVRRAVEELVRAQVLTVRHGAGTFVAPPALRYEVTVGGADRHATAAGLAETAASLGRTVSEDLLGITRDNHPEARQHLAVPRAALCRVDTRLRVSGEPWAISSAWLEERRFPRLAARWGSHAGLWDVLREEYGIGVVYAWRSFGARSASPSDAAELAIPAGSALVVRDGLSLDGNARPTVYVHRRCRGDRMTFVMRYT